MDSHVFVHLNAISWPASKSCKGSNFVLSTREGRVMCDEVSSLLIFHHLGWKSWCWKSRRGWVILCSLSKIRSRNVPESHPGLVMNGHLGLWQDFCQFNWVFGDLPNTWSDPAPYCISALLILAFMLVCVLPRKIDVQKANKKPTIHT